MIIEIGVEHCIKSNCEGTLQDHIFMIIEIGVEHFIKSKCEGTLQDYKAQALILQSCTDDYMVRISHYTSAYDMWNHLIKLFVGRTNDKLMALNEEVRLFKMKANEKPSSYVLRARKIANTLRSLGRPHDDMSTCMMVLHGSHEYNDIKQIQLSLCDTDPDVDRVQHTLDLAHMNIEANKQEQKRGRDDKQKGRPSNSPGQGKAHTTPSSHTVQTDVVTKQPTDVQGCRPAIQQVGRPTIIRHNCGEAGHIEKCLPWSLIYHKPCRIVEYIKCTLCMAY